MSFLEELYIDMFPLEAAQRLSARSKRFVHYTSAEVAMSILQLRKVWMRNTRTMNDFSEIEHGVKCLTTGLNSDSGVRLNNIVRENFEDYGLMPFALRDNLDWLKNNTWITCISEHEDREDGIGRLSMWRAYGGSTGVAIVVNNTPFMRASDELGAFTFPVTYSNGSDFIARFQHMADVVEAKLDYYKKQEWSLAPNLIMLIKYLMLCTKHPGFQEEREWRVVYTPFGERSPYIKSEIRNVRGTPQRVYMLPLENIPEIDFFGAAPSEFIDHIIIGPTSHPHVMREAFVQLLVDLDVLDADKKVIISDIPLRHYY